MIDIIYACFEAIRGDPDFDALALLTYDEDFAKEWVAEYPYTIHPLEKCPTCGQWGTAADHDDEDRESSEGRWYTPWKLDIPASPLRRHDLQPHTYSVNQNQTHLHIVHESSSKPYERKK